MLKRSSVAPGLGAFIMVGALACGGSGLKTTQKADGQVTTCFYGGKTYNLGDQFSENCYTCSCGSDGRVMCPTLVCLGDAGSAPRTPDAALPDAQADAAVPPDLANDVKPAMDVVGVIADLRPGLPAAADSAKDAVLAPDTTKDSQPVADAGNVDVDASPVLHLGRECYSVGQAVPMGDGATPASARSREWHAPGSLAFPLTMLPRWFARSRPR